MKILLTCLMTSVSILLFSPLVSAVEAEGTIDEVRVCSLGGDWRNVAFLKLSNGSWFSIFSNNQSNNLYDDPYTFSLITTAYTSRLKVKLNFTHPGSTACGLTSVAALSANTTDYIALKEFSEP